MQSETPAAQSKTSIWGRPASAAFIALAVAWSAIIAWNAWTEWPRLSLDSSPDATSMTALRTAEATHLARAIALGGGGSALFFTLAVMIGRRRKPPLPAQVWTGPARILLMRHAEKTGDLDDIHLSKAGQRRADRLATYIPDTFGRPDFIFAAARSRRSIRSIETMQPLAAATSKDVRFDIEDKQFAALVDDLKADPVYKNALVVICWHHGKIPAIAAALGAPDGTYPADWPDETFDLILELDYSRGAPPVARQIIEPF